MVPQNITAVSTGSFTELCTAFFSRYAFAFRLAAECMPEHTVSILTETILKEIYIEGLIPEGKYDELSRDSIMLDYAFSGDIRQIAEAVFLKIINNNYWAKEELEEGELEIMKKASSCLENIRNKK
jgi:hypothetical protein